MMKCTHFSIAAALTATILSAGCAKQQLVKQEQLLSGAATGEKRSTSTTPPPAASTSRAEQQPIPAMKGTGEATAMQADSSPVASALEKIYFGFDSYILSEKARESLGKNAEIIAKSGKKFVIEGNCDERGSDEYNLALGERRAKAAVRYLVTLGIDPGRLSVVSYGEERPFDPSHTEEAWSKNRRDEISALK